MKNKKNFDNENEKIDSSRDEKPNDDVNYNEFYPENEEELASGELDEDTVVFAMKERERKKNIKKKNGRMTKGQVTLICVLAVIYVLLLSLAAWLIFYKPPIDPDDIPFDITEDDGTDTETGKEKNTGTVQEYSEAGQSYNILLVGHDQLAHLADVTMIVNCDTKNKTVSVMQIPRDTYISLEYMTGKINAMYSSYYKNAVYAGSENAYIDSLEEYADLLEKNLCIKIHQTAIINLDGFKKIVDALGGVDVYVPNDMKYNDPEQGLHIDIPAGNQHLDGEMAEGFVRFRSGYIQADIGRVNAQKIFLTALFSKLKSTVKTVDVSTLNALIQEIKDNVNTEMTVSDIMYYAKLALKIDLEDIKMMTIPGTVAGNYYVINREATRQAVNTYFNVYNKEISDKIFDRNKVFCSDADYISAVYYSSPENVLDGVYTGDSINDDSIYIPRTQTWTPSYNNNTWYPDYDSGNDYGDQSYYTPDNDADTYVPDNTEIPEENVNEDPGEIIEEDQTVPSDESGTYINEIQTDSETEYVDETAPELPEVPEVTEEPEETEQIEEEIYTTEENNG